MHNLNGLYIANYSLMEYEIESKAFAGICIYVTIKLDVMILDF